MKKNQDVQAISDATTLDEKLSAALTGRQYVSKAKDLLSSFLMIQNYKMLKAEGAVLKIGKDGGISFGKPSKNDLKRIEEQHGSLNSWYDSIIESAERDVVEIVVKSLEDRNREFFVHLASACSNKQYLEDSQASRVDVLTLILGYEYRESWPNVPMTRADLDVYLAKMGCGGIDPKTLTAVIKRTGIKLKKDKPGPRPERRSRTR